MKNTKNTISKKVEISNNVETLKNIDFQELKAIYKEKRQELKAKKQARKELNKETSQKRKELKARIKELRDIRKQASQEIKNIKESIKALRD